MFVCMSVCITCQSRILTKSLIAILKAYNHICDLFKGAEVKLVICYIPYLLDRHSSTYVHECVGVGKTC